MIHLRINPGLIGPFTGALKNKYILEYFGVPYSKRTPILEA
jgi:hypothetical protein